MILLIIVLVIFGPKNLPRLAKSMGQAIRDFRSGIKGVEDELSDDDDGPVETSARIERKGSNSVSSEQKPGVGDEKKAHGPS